MPGFKFELSQRVAVPGLENQQGRIAGRTEFVNGAAVYQIKWLEEDLSVHTEMYSEAEIVAAQAKKPDSAFSIKVEADTSEFTDSMKEATAAANMLKVAADEAIDSAARLPRNVLELGARANRRTKKRRARR